jgi:hypothetical protein
MAHAAAAGCVHSNYSRLLIRDLSERKRNEHNCCTQQSKVEAAKGFTISLAAFTMRGWQGDERREREREREKGREKRRESTKGWDIEG